MEIRPPSSRPMSIRVNESSATSSGRVGTASRLSATNSTMSTVNRIGTAKNFGFSQRVSSNLQNVCLIKVTFLYSGAHQRSTDHATRIIWIHDVTGKIRNNIRHATSQRQAILDCTVAGKDTGDFPRDRKVEQRTQESRPRNICQEIVREKS